MEKRFILAIILSLLVLLTWSSFVSKTQYVENKEVTNIIPPKSDTQNKVPNVLNLSETSLVEFSYGKWILIFSEPRAAVKEVIFKEYRDYRFPLFYGFLQDEETSSFVKTDSTENSITFTHKDEIKEISKRFTFSNSNYTIELEVGVKNLSNLPLSINYPILLGGLDFSAKNIHARFQDVTIADQDKILRFDAKKSLEAKNIKFVSLRDRYFCLIMEPEEKNYTGFIKKINNQRSNVGLYKEPNMLVPGQQIGQKYRIYLGPQELRTINSINSSWSTVMNFGAFNFVAKMILQLLYFLYDLVHNWGWAIVILSLVVYLSLFPLSLKQMRSMKEMQLLQPQIDALRNAYKDNPQRLNKEILELYRKHKVNPFSGCLPLLLQMPIFLSLYQALMRSVALRGASFLWIKDLSEPDRLFTLPASLPVLGNEINILPILMTIGMFVQQKISLKAAPSGNVEQQKMMMIIFPLMFGVIFYHMPSGLVLYWFINSSVMLVYQGVISRTK